MLRESAESHTPQDFPSFATELGLLAGREVQSSVKFGNSLSRRVSGPLQSPDLPNLERFESCDALRRNQMAMAELKNFFDAVADYERKLIGEALAQSDGNQAKAARILGLKPTTLNSQIQRLGINVNLYRHSPNPVTYETFKKFLLWKTDK